MALARVARAGQGNAICGSRVMRRFRRRQASRWSVRPEGRDKVAAGLAVLMREEDEAVPGDWLQRCADVYMEFVVWGEISSGKEALIYVHFFSAFLIDASMMSLLAG